MGIFSCFCNTFTKPNNFCDFALLAWKKNSRDNNQIVIPVRPPVAARLSIHHTSTSLHNQFLLPISASQFVKGIFTLRGFSHTSFGGCVTKLYPTFKLYELE